MARKRRAISRKKSRKMFSKTSTPHKKNRIEGYNMRGGYRL